MFKLKRYMLQHAANKGSKHNENELIEPVFLLRLFIATSENVAKGLLIPIIRVMSLDMSICLPSILMCKKTFYYLKR
jgi:hypothetical protein